jgi:hypothetical protein
MHMNDSWDGFKKGVWNEVNGVEWVFKRWFGKEYIYGILRH